MFGKLGMMQTVSIGAVVVAVAGWAVYTQTDWFRTAPVVEAADTPIAVEVEETPEVSESVSETPEQAETVDTAPSSDDVVAEETDVAEDEAETSETEDAAIVLNPPAFDVVRVETDGMTVIAGTGPAGWLISILIDGEVVDTVEADASGQFVAILDIGTSEMARVVTLSAKNADQILLSDAQVIIAPVIRQIAEDDAADEAPSADATTEEVAEGDVTETAEVETQVGATTEDQPDEPVVEGTTSDEAPATDSSDEAEVAEDEASDDAAAQDEVAEVDSSEGVSEATEAEVDVADADSTEEQGDTQPVETTSEADDTADSSDAVAVEEAPAETVDVAEASGDTTDAEDTSETSDDQPVGEVEVVEDSAPAVLLVENDSVTVLQPASESPQVMDELSISAISYSDDGAVQLSGISPAGFLRVYLNNVAIMELEVPEAGEWRAELVDVVPGVYTLRIDQVDENGDVQQRVETPFKREEPATVVEAAQTRRPLVSVEVVQPGSTLWAISRENYGSGVLFVRIFEANKDQIRDPDLIYPGQIFDLPAPPGAQKKKRTSGQ